MKKINRKNIVILLLYVPGSTGKEGESIKGITRFAKFLFLLKEMYHIEKKVDKYYSFTPYKLGPFTDILYDDLEFLETVGIIKVRDKEYLNDSETLEINEIITDLYSEVGGEILAADAYKEYEFSLTDRGKSLAKQIYDTIDKQVLNATCKIKKEFSLLPLTKLLAFVYQKYPDMAKETIRPDLRKVEA